MHAVVMRKEGDSIGIEISGVAQIEHVGAVS